MANGKSVIRPISSVLIKFAILPKKKPTELQVILDQQVRKNQK